MSIPVAENTPVRVLRIQKPHVEYKDGQASQICEITCGEVKRTVIFSVPEAYGEYLTTERSDAYVLGLLSFAMRERCDIVCETPMTEELLHQLRTEFLPALHKFEPKLHLPKIQAEVDGTPLACAGKVGTGCSCGVDSLTAIKHLTESDCPGIHLDYLVLHNVGAYSWKGHVLEKRYEEGISNIQHFANEYHYKILVTNSNISEAFPQLHEATHGYTIAFATYMLRKLWKRYYYASAGFEHQPAISLEGHANHAFGYYELFALQCFSIPQLRLCSESLVLSRFDKTRELINYEPAHRFLNVCVRNSNRNCGECFKCKRTLLTLDALNALDSFSHVFPVDAYRKNRARYMRELYLSHLKHDSMLEGTYRILSPQIGLWNKIRVLLSIRGLRAIRDKICNKRKPTVYDH